jgi:hypothetical protein
MKIERLAAIRRRWLSRALGPLIAELALYIKKIAGTVSSVER